MVTSGFFSNASTKLAKTSLFQGEAMALPSSVSTQAIVTIGHFNRSVAATALEWAGSRGISKAK